MSAGRLVLLVTALLAPSLLPAQARVRTPQVEATLLPETRSVRPGSPFRVALRLRIAPGWHVYWTNPGETGLPTEVRWELPRGFRVGPLQWTHPERLELSSVVAHGYHGEAVAFAEIHPPPGWEGRRVDLRAQARWGVCREVCIPQDARLSLSLPVRASAPRPHGGWRAVAAAAGPRVPRTLPGWKLRARREGGGVALRVDAPPGRELPPGPITFFPADPRAGAAVVAEAKEGGAELVLGGADPAGSAPGGAPVRVQGVLVARSGWDAAGRFPALRVDVAVETAPPR